MLPPYAVEYQTQHGSLPWLLTGSDAPWLPLLPPEAKGSLHEWGRYLFSQTAACKRGSVSVDRYDQWLDKPFFVHELSAPDTLARCCAAFAYSPLSVVIDIRAAMQCISLAVKESLGPESSKVGIMPLLVEQQLDHVCAAGCGKDLSQGHTHIPQYGKRPKYCSQECAQEVSSAALSDAAVWLYDLCCHVHMLAR